MLIYLASPYSHSDPEIRRQRFETVCFAAANFMRDGHHIFSPIAHTHPIALHGELPKGWEFWQEYDRKIIAVCGELWVLRMDGWDKSVGVQAEIKIAEELGIPVKYV